MRLKAIALCLAALAGVPPASAQSAFTTEARYDALRRVVGTIAPDPDGAGPLRHAAVRNGYDVAGRLVRQETGELAVWQSETVAPSAWTGFTIFTTTDTAYDALDRKVKVTVSGGGAIHGVTQFGYDALGRLECTAVRMNPAIFATIATPACQLGTQGSGANDFGPDRITRNVYDIAGQLLKVQKAYGTAIQQDYVTYTHNLNGKVTSVTDANGNKASMSFDGHDRQVKWSFPSQTTPGQVSATDYEEYGYDASGNRLTLRKRDGRTLTYSYDALDRLTVKVVPDACVGGYACTQPPASAVRDVYYGYDLRGLQTAARFGSASGSDAVLTSYDALGRIASSTTSMGGISRTLAYQYDANGNRTRITHPDGGYIAYAYDGLDRVTAHSASSGGGPELVLAQAGYNAQGLRSQLARVLGSTQYGYDGALRLTQQVDRFANSTISATTGFAYNPAGQIVTRTRDDAAYAFTGHVNVSRAYAANGLNQYTSAGPATFGYDGNGNLASDGTNSFTFDAENRLVAASAGASSVTLTYDPLGRLFEVSGTAGTTHFLYDGDALAAEYDGAGTLLWRYLHGAGPDEPVAALAGGLIDCSGRQLYADHQGSIIAVADCAGQRIAVNRYDEYGIPAGTNQGRFQYTGQAWIPELGMYHYKARVYSPTLGRFLQVDPIGYDDQVNLYAYVGNDPMNGRDPDGKMVWWLVKLLKTAKPGQSSMKNVRRVTKEQARVARQQGENVRAPNRQAARQLERSAAADPKSVMRHKGHNLKDEHGKPTGEKGESHYQTEGKSGHTFFSMAGAFFITAIEYASELIDPLLIKDVADGTCSGRGGCEKPTGEDDRKEEEDRKRPTPSPLPRHDDDEKRR